MNITLTELEEMLPFEREVYLVLFKQKLERYELNKQAKAGR